MGALNGAGGATGADMQFERCMRAFGHLLTEG